MVYVSGCLLAGILWFLAALHLYWAFGGGVGRSVVLPKLQGTPLFRPGPLSCVLVTSFLALAGWVVAIRGGLVAFAGLETTVGYGCWTLAVIFCLRAIGDFRYVGFLKSIRDSDFAYWDTRLFSPLCLVMSGLALVVARG